MRNSRTNPGEAGTLRIEFGTLSKLTGKSEYYAAAKNAVQQIYNRRSPIGLVGTWIDAETGTWLDPDSHLSACIDSYYEYMVKCEILFGDEDLGRIWESSIVAVNTHLAHETGSGLWYGHAELKSVVSKEKNDRTESYFLAETLKNLYLLYAPPEALDFRTTVFNTEAHPIRRTW